MIHTIQEFLQWWAIEANNTAELFGSIHDEDLHKRLVPRFQNMGELAWNLLETPKELLAKAGVDVTGPARGSSPPKSTNEILSMHNEVVKSVLKNVHDQWDDRSLDQTVSVKGENGVEKTFCSPFSSTTSTTGVSYLSWLP